MKALPHLPLTGREEFDEPLDDKAHSEAVATWQAALSELKKIAES